MCASRLGQAAWRPRALAYFSATGVSDRSVAPAAAAAALCAAAVCSHLPAGMVLSVPASTRALHSARRIFPLVVLGTVRGSNSSTRTGVSGACAAATACRSVSHSSAAAAASILGSRTSATIAMQPFSESSSSSPPPSAARGRGTVNAATQPGRTASLASCTVSSTSFGFWDGHKYGSCEEQSTALVGSSSRAGAKACVWLWRAGWAFCWRDSGLNLRSLLGCPRQLHEAPGSATRAYAVQRGPKERRSNAHLDGGLSTAMRA
eukprot:356357-Chlamydomonas_euryale.AAC.7